jgi:hypothetical protein
MDGSELRLLHPISAVFGQGDLAHQRGRGDGLSSYPHQEPWSYVPAMVMQNYPRGDKWRVRMNRMNEETVEVRESYCATCQNSCIYLTPPTPRSIVWGRGRGLSKDFTGIGAALLHRGSLC